MSVATHAPSAPPAAPQATSNAFQPSPSRDPLRACASSIAAEYMAISTNPRRIGRVLSSSALSALNPTRAKARMLYALRRATCHESDEGDVASYTASLVATQNRIAASATATTLHILRAELP